MHLTVCCLSSKPYAQMLCVCVCVCACMYSLRQSATPDVVCVCVCVYVFPEAVHYIFEDRQQTVERMKDVLCVHVCMCVCVYVCMCVCVYVCMYSLRQSTNSALPLRQSFLLHGSPLKLLFSACLCPPACLSLGLLPALPPCRPPARRPLPAALTTGQAMQRLTFYPWSFCPRIFA